MSSEAQFVDAALADNLLGDGEDAGRVVDFAPRQNRGTVIAFVGMAFEAKIAAAPGVLVFSRNKRRELHAAVEKVARHGCRGLISFGVAGGLAAGLRPGDWVVASAVVGPQMTRATDKTWSSELLDAIGGASYAPIVGVDAPIAEPAIKRQLHRTTGAAAVDMESHVVARLSAAHGLAFTALRVIVDPADRAIPTSALMGMSTGADDHADGFAVLRELLARPSQLSRLARISLDAYIACAEMRRVRRLIGPHFGLSISAEAGLVRADMAQADMAQADMAQADMAQADMAQAGVVQADLARARLAPADLSGPELACAPLRQADAAPYRSLA